MLLLLSVALALVTEKKHTIPQAGWSADDSTSEHEVIGTSYKDLDKVQDALLDAADKELEEEKKLPTLEQATHHWHMGDTPDKPSSLVETGAQPDIIGGVDFSNIDHMGDKLAHIHSEMNGDIAKLKAQTVKDENSYRLEAADARKLPSLMEDHPQALAPGDVFQRKLSPELEKMREEAIARKLVLEQFVKESEGQGHGSPEFEKAKMAIIEHALLEQQGKKEQRIHAVEALQKKKNALDRLHTAHAHAVERHEIKMTDERFGVANNKLLQLEHTMEERKMKMGDTESPEAKFAREKIEKLVALSNKARAVLTSSLHGAEPNSPEHIAEIQAIKQQILSLKNDVGGHLSDHLHLMDNALQDHVSFVQQETKKADPNAGDTGSYQKIQENLSHLQDRIKGQIQTLKAHAAKETDRQVNSLQAIEVDAGGNMRTD